MEIKTVVIATAHWWQQPEIWAAIITAAVFVVGAWLIPRKKENGAGAGVAGDKRRRYFAVLLGKDGRLSTSITVAAAWTAVTLWGVITLLFAWPKDWSVAMADFDGSYLALLGGPYASFVLSGAIVGGKVKNNTLQKTPGSGAPRISDLVSNDEGDPDLFDLQYVIFNGAAMAFVIDAFIRTGDAGFPPIPTALILLTGGPAAIYVLNKSLATNGPAISAVQPSTASSGEKITVYGTNLVVGDDVKASKSGKPAKATVWVGGVATTDVKIAGESLTAVIGQGSYPSGALDVTVITAAETPVSHPNAVSINPGLVVRGIGAAPGGAFGQGSYRQGSTITLVGSWPDPTTETLILSFGGKPGDPAATPASATTAQATFPIPNLGLAAGGTPVHVSLVLSQAAKTLKLGTISITP